MIYTVTLNPTIDYLVNCQNFNINSLNRYTEESYTPGGKGINVSLVLSELGIKNKALGFAAGFTGKEIVRYLSEKNISADFDFLKSGISRINMKVISNDETEINGAGPSILKEESEAFLNKFSSITSGNILVLAGSLPSSIPKDYYAQILERCGNCISIVDAVGEELLTSLKFKPFLIKPNHHELGDIFHVKIKSIQDAEYYGKKLCVMGAQNVIVSMGGEGALLIPGDEPSIFMPPIKGKVVSTCCAGDSMVAGFIYGYSLNSDFREAMEWGTAAGAGAAFTAGTPKRNSVIELYKKLKDGFKAI